MKTELLIKNNVFPIPVGDFFHKETDACYLVYAPLSNVFYLSTGDEVRKLEQTLEKGEDTPLVQKLLKQDAFKAINQEVSVDTFCTLHLLLNEKCNFSCKYCYSANGRSKAELTEDQIYTTLDYFLSSERAAVKDRTVMFMGGGEPTLSWNLLEKSTLYAERTAKANDVNLHLSLTTNGSILDDKMIAFLKEHDFTVQISFEVLPDIQNEQRGQFDKVAENVNRIAAAGINNYVRSTITASNVDRIPEMVEYCHQHFPEVKKLSCQQVVDPEYFKTTDIVHDFFDRYFRSFREGVALAEKYGIALRSSSSHLLNYSKRERFCYNLVCLTPYGTLTTCPDVSSPKEPDYKDAVFASLNDGKIEFDNAAFRRLTSGSIHTIEKCSECYAKWNCGSGCPSSRRVYNSEIFDAVCDYYRKILCFSLMDELADKYQKSTGKDMYKEIGSKL